MYILFQARLSNHNNTNLEVLNWKLCWSALFRQILEMFWLASYKGSLKVRCTFVSFIALPLYNITTMCMDPASHAREIRTSKLKWSTRNKMLWEKVVTRQLSIWFWIWRQEEDLVHPSRRELHNKGGDKAGQEWLHFGMKFHPSLVVVMSLSSTFYNAMLNIITFYTIFLPSHHCTLCFFCKIWISNALIYWVDDGAPPSWQSFLP